MTEEEWELHPDRIKTICDKTTADGICAINLKNIMLNYITKQSND
jgi:hypothetical protein